MRGRQYICKQIAKMHRRRYLVCCLVLLCSLPALAQVWVGEVVGTASGVVHKYKGEFTDDLFGYGGQVSLQYAPHERIILEPRFGYGTTSFKLSPSDLAAYPEYFGSGAELGDLYPGTSTAIENKNTINFFTIDALFNYVLIPRIPATVLLTAGVGYINWQTTTNSNQPLPVGTGYSNATVSIPVGVGTRIPISSRVGLLLRVEHRFVFSDWVDNVNLVGGNDAFTNASIGLTYRFTDPPPTLNSHNRHNDDGWYNAQAYQEPLYDCQPSCVGECFDEEYCNDHHCCVWPCGACCEQCCGCCCCCCGCTNDSGGGGAAPAPAPAPEPAKPPTPEPPAPSGPSRRFSKDIRFKLDTDEFDFDFPQTESNLTELLDYMVNAPEGHEVIIEGHASSEGPPERNKVLSDLRAKAIRSWLLDHGVDPSKIRGTVGYGSSVPRVQEPTPAEAKRMKPGEVERLRAQNRRIEINVLKDAYAKGS